jgi:hypothetical protein
MMSENKYSQNWQKSKHGDKPVFHVNGKRVSLLEGFKLTQDGFYGHVPYLQDWFTENGYTNYEAEKLANDDNGSLVKVRSQLLQVMEDLHNPEKTKDTVWLTGNETLFERVSCLYVTAGGSDDYLKQRWPEYF